MKKLIFKWMLLFLMVSGALHSRDAGAQSDNPPVIAPPDSFFELVAARDREVARAFYKKYIDVKGMPVVASSEVSDIALQRTYWIVTHLLAGRPDVIESMKSIKMYLIVIGKDQVYTDMPEYRNNPNPAYQNERVRGTGGRPTSFGEENVISWPIDRYDDESIGVHEFCHTIDTALRSIDPTWNQRKLTAYNDALKKGLWRLTYAASNPAEFWAEICQTYFDCNRVNNWNHGPIGTREQFKIYDPESYELVRSTFNLSPENDWRYTWMQKLPNVTTPPAKFKIDLYYTKFSWAREFPVIGRDASDEALLKANDLIRKVFAYRHDILKAIINDGGKMVVLGPKERIADLPEYKLLKEIKGFDSVARMLDYEPEARLMVVPEENVMRNPKEKLVGESLVIRECAKAIYTVAGTRPIDPEFEKRPSNLWQQYELRVKRLDVQFDDKLKELFDAGIAAGKWKGSAACNSRMDYWTEGVVAYFDAMGQEGAPNDNPHPITNRQQLKEYDPALYALVNETMAYDGHVDWHYTP